MLPANLRETLTQLLGAPLVAVMPCHGGDINHAVQVRTTDAQFFVKWHPNAPHGMFEAEARGLNLLRATNTLTVPEVVAYADATADTPAFLVLAWLEAGPNTPQTDILLGEGLAHLHNHIAPQHGLDHANFIGSLPQINTPTATWAEFYGEQRLRPQLAIAQNHGIVSAKMAHQIETLITRLPELVPPAEAALLHGDLWRGNVMVLADGKPAVIDPAVYYGHSEVELAFTELFGGFSRDFYAAYATIRPIDKGYEQRRKLYQLYPLMVHMTLFGGSYSSQVQAILNHYAT